MQAEEKKLKVLKLEIEAGRHDDTATSSSKARERVQHMLVILDVVIVVYFQLLRMSQINRHKGHHIRGCGHIKEGVARGVC